MENKIDHITLKDAVETPFWMAIWAGEPDRKINVEMSYEDLRIITDLIENRTPEKGKTCETCDYRRMVDGEYRCGGVLPKGYGCKHWKGKTDA